MSSLGSFAPPVSNSFGKARVLRLPCKHCDADCVTSDSVVLIAHYHKITVWHTDGRTDYLLLLFIIVISLSHLFLLRFYHCMYVFMYRCIDFSAAQLKVYLINVLTYLLTDLSVLRSHNCTMQACDKKWLLVNTVLSKLQIAKIIVKWIDLNSRYKYDLRRMNERMF